MIILIVNNKQQLDSRKKKKEEKERNTKKPFFSTLMCFDEDALIFFAVSSLYPYFVSLTPFFCCPIDCQQMLRRIVWASRKKSTSKRGREK